MDDFSDLEKNFSTFNTSAFTLYIGEVLHFHAVSKDKVRSLEKHMIAQLLHQSGIDSKQLRKTSLGKPYLQGDKRSISLAHSQGWYVLAVSDFSIGVDIEQNRNSLAAGRDYFVNKQEETIQDLLAIWTAKEAFYKLFGGEIGDLKEDVSVFQVDENSISLNYENVVYTGNLLYIANNYCVVFINT